METKKGRCAESLENPSPRNHKRKLDSLRRKLNRRRYVHPDPLEFLYRYDSIRDREIAGLIASSLAYGRVAQILKSVKNILDPMEDSPSMFLQKTTPDEMRKIYKDFRHRFNCGDDIVALLLSIKELIRKHGSIEACFMAGLAESDETVIPALTQFVDSLRAGSSSDCGFLLPYPEKGSACKRLNLYLRWMVRADDVDPGGWYNISASKLVVPLDTHLFQVSMELGFTRRKQADMRTAFEITDAFRIIDPDDPVKYDFALTRAGIWNGGAPDA